MRTATAAIAASAAILFAGWGDPCEAAAAFSSAPTTAAAKTTTTTENGGSPAMGGGEGHGRRAFLAGIAGATFAGAASALPPVAVPPAHASSLPDTGTRAPDFDLPNSRGEGTTSLSALTGAGKWTVLYFYPGAFTSGCTLEARNFQKDIERYRSLGAQIVGVSVDPVEKNAAFCSSEGLDFYMLSDRGGEVSRRYGSALSVPGFGTFSNRQTYIIDPRGNLRWVFTDVESRVLRHSAEVLEKLEELTKA